MSMQKTRVGYLQLPVPSKDIPTVVADLRALGVTPPTDAAEPRASDAEIAKVAAKVEAARSALLGREKKREKSGRRLTEVPPLAQGAPDAKRRGPRAAMGETALLFAKLRPRWEKRVALGLLIAALLALGARGVLRAQRERAPEVQRRKATVSALHAETTPATAVTTTTTTAQPDEDDLAPVEAVPMQAARSFALGEFERALRQYRYLAEAHPEQTAYPLMVKVLAARARAR